mmetsp:Transcript_17561/g.38953  ORF Transcript_17561/g.38953 Transcript_17561/m.38953 type:complete len:119 (-) Transcript_17561:515-871(-)
MSAKPARVLNNLITELAIRCCSAHGEDERAQTAAEAVDLPAAERRKTNEASSSASSASAEASASSASSPSAPAFCDWTGALADAEAHKKVCLFELQVLPSQGYQERPSGAQGRMSAPH